MLSTPTSPSNPLISEYLKSLTFGELKWEFGGVVRKGLCMESECEVTGKK